MSFHNTVNLTGNDLATAIDRCSRQEKLVLRTMQAEFAEKLLDKDFDQSNYEGMTPPEVWQKIGQLTCPLTSIRRAMSDLTKKNLLSKTSHQRKGIYGMVNYTWKLNQ